MTSIQKCLVVAWKVRQKRGNSVPVAIEQAGFCSPDATAQQKIYSRSERIIIQFNDPGRINHPRIITVFTVCGERWLLIFFLIDPSREALLYNGQRTGGGKSQAQRINMLLAFSGGAGAIGAEHYLFTHQHTVWIIEIIG